MMNIQGFSTVQYRLPVKVFILNNQYMGMVPSGRAAVRRPPFRGYAIASRFRSVGRGVRRGGGALPRARA